MMRLFKCDLQIIFELNICRQHLNRCYSRQKKFNITKEEKKKLYIGIYICTYFRFHMQGCIFHLAPLSFILTVICFNYVRDIFFLVLFFREKYFEIKKYHAIFNNNTIFITLILRDYLFKYIGETGRTSVIWLK